MIELEKPLSEKQIAYVGSVYRHCQHVVKTYSVDAIALGFFTVIREVKYSQYTTKQ
ncbi:hypothetical protein KIN20_007468 [Parelaphostrongylus tenuis]|uniref:Uncharacterized protein n=1 Tax=Parelaphostrongylus tenuis TaxID=148309 RepID=A0AAD5QK24_PARTN|nr:hypothetical protein KIN20_007468 [Parelaphostrongylus tenuis]